MKKKKMMRAATPPMGLVCVSVELAKGLILSCDADDLQVNVETPSPCCVIGKDTTEKRTNNTSDSVTGAEETGEGRCHLGRGGEGNDRVAARGDTRTACTGNSAADDEGGAVGCDTTDQGAELEDGDGGEEGDFEGEVFVDFAPGMG